MTSADSSSHRRSEHLLGFNISPEEASLTRGASTKEAEDALSRWGQQVSVCERRRRREERYLWRAVVSMVSVCCVVRNVRFESVCRRRHHHLHPPTYCSSQWHHCQQDTNSPAAETPTLRSRRRTVNCGACLEADQSTNTSWGAQIYSLKHFLPTALSLRVVQSQARGLKSVHSEVWLGRLEVYREKNIQKWAKNIYNLLFMLFILWNIGFLVTNYRSQCIN